MNAIVRNLLVAALACLIGGLACNLGLVNVENFSALYVLFPLGAVLLGLFGIARMLQKESALYDQEHGAVQAPADRPAPTVHSARPAKAH